MTRQISTLDDIFKILDKLDLLSDKEDVLNKFDEDFMPQGDVSESEDDLEINSEKSKLPVVQNQMMIMLKLRSLLQNQQKVWKTSVPPVTRRCHCNIVT